MCILYVGILTDTRSRPPYLDQQNIRLHESHLPIQFDCCLCNISEDSPSFSWIPFQDYEAAPVCKTKNICVNRIRRRICLGKQFKWMLTVKLLGFDAIVTTQLKYSSGDGASNWGSSKNWFRLVILMLLTLAAISVEELNESSNIKSDELNRNA